jgi:hypothetical protein
MGKAFQTIKPEERYPFETARYDRCLMKSSPWDRHLIVTTPEDRRLACLSKTYQEKKHERFTL